MSIGALQLKASLKRMALEKRRNLRITCCEFFSHLILLVILVLGYNLSEVANFPAKTYTDVTIRIPPAGFTDTNLVNLTAIDSLGILRSVEELLEGPLKVPNLDQFLLLSELVSSQVDTQFGDLIGQTAFGRVYTNLLFYGDLHLAPSGPLVDDFVSYMRSNYQRFDTLNLYIHASEDEAVAFILDSPGSALALIVFRQISPEKVNYVIRQNYTTLPNTNSVVNPFTIGLNTEYQNYYVSGFLSIQKAVDEWVFNRYNEQAGSSSKQCGSPPNPTIAPFPTAAYDQNPFYLQVGFLLGLAMVMSTLYPMSRLTKSIVEEKELKLREIMKIMGLRDWVHQLSWFISAFILFFWISVSSVFVTGSSFLVNSDPILLFAFYFLFTMSEIMFSFLVSVFFSNSKLAAIVAPVLLFIGIVPRFVFLDTNANERVNEKIACSLLSPTAFTFGADLIANYEYTGVGIQFSNINDGRFSFAVILSMLFVDFWLYAFLAWYLDQVVPHEYGTARHLLFFLDWRYWFGDCYDWLRAADTRDPTHVALVDSMPEFTNNSLDEEAITASTVEALPAECKAFAAVCIDGLRKRYSDGKLAVKNLSMCMLEGQITCLLGHNGAGKSTTISTLIGMIEMTSGNVSIYGKSLRRELSAIRRLIGVCPQQNVLFPTLTVSEHLKFFGNLKGWGGSRLQQNIDEVIRNVGLTEKRHVLSSALSGGMKRKLCLAIALVGDPKFVLLDEPTSGMDPHSRRSTWELLQKCKEGRVVVLTTHFMEEADTLADRIAILSEGRLRCSGSSLYLKNRFGLGYLLSIAKSDAALIDPITEAVQAIVRDATVNSSIAGEVVYRMPIQAVPQFPELFAMLRDGASQLRITSYGISITTLEQVFIKLAREADSADLEDNFDLQNSQDEGLDSWSFRIQSLLWRIRQSFSGHRRIESLSQSDEERGIEIANSAAVATPSVGSTMAPTIVENQNLSDQGSSEVARAETIQYIALATTDGETKDKEDLVLPFAVYHTNESKTSIDEPMAQPVKVVEELPIVDDLPTATSSSFNSTLAAIAANIYIRQFVELYRKRLIIACRDYKGLFFQVIFPAIQIILIMLILTINVNPAGNTIVLSSNAFSRYAGFTPEVIFGGATTSFSDTETNLLNTRSDVDNILTNVSDSITLSKLMVDFDKNLTESYNNSFLGNGDNRYGAYLFDDRIPFNITVDWDWVKLNADFILQNEELINNLAEVFGFNATIDSLLVDNLNLNVDLISLLELINATANIDNNFNNFIATPINDNFNLSIGNNFGDVLDFLEETLNFTASANNVDAVIRIGSISYDPNRNTIRLFNISVVSTDTNLQLDINEVDLGLRNLTQLLPTGSESYLFDLESKKTVLFNSSSPHGAAIFQGEMVGAQYQTCSSAGTNSEYLIKNHPLPITLRSSLEIRVILSILTSLFILVPLCYIPAAFVAFLVKERVSKSKHLQFVSGVSPYMYWLGTYAWDLSLFAAIVGFILAGFFAFGEDAAAVYISEGESTVGLFLLLFLYGAAAIPLSYIYSFMFTNFSTAQISVMVINFMTGFVAVLAYFVMSNVPSTQAAAEDIVHFFRFFPPYNVGEGMINLAAAYFVNEVLDESVGYLDWEVSGRNIVFMAAQAVGYFGVILLTEFPPLQNLIYSIQRYRSVNVRAIPPPAQQPDEDVLKEAEHINDDGFPSEDYALVIKNLVKTYPATVLGGKPKHAVRGVSFACKNGERFGLLGINGAGKTTTLSILTADAQPTAGDVLIGGKSASHSSTHRMIGYCPQVDPLLDLMTGFETLRFFGRIRGLPESEVEEKVQRLVQQVGLRKHAHKPCGTYSGGNKRKLSLAVALIGDPRVLFLDEPSTGMDAEARRHMWTVIEEVSQNRSVVLVSHSMEEVEALCTRMGVMVSGRLQCLGTAQHLKDRFGGGYQVELRCQPLRVSDCLQLCLQVFPNASISEQYGGYFRLDTSRNIDLSEAFGTLERSKDSHGIYDYSISQCTLEQIFIQFAKEQEEERPPETAAITASDTTSESQVAPKAIITIESTTQQI